MSTKRKLSHTLSRVLMVEWSNNGTIEQSNVPLSGSLAPLAPVLNFISTIHLPVFCFYCLLSISICYFYVQCSIFCFQFSTVYFLHSTFYFVYLYLFSIFFLLSTLYFRCYSIYSIIYPPYSKYSTYSIMIEENYVNYANYANDRGPVANNKLSATCLHRRSGDTVNP